MHEIRWNPLIRQWIIVAEHRATRPWRPEEKQVTVQCPFCPGAPELKDLGEWDVVSLPNKYPALRPDAEKPGSYGFSEYVAIEAKGYSKVIVETPDHEGDLYTLSLPHVSKIMEIFRQEYIELGKTGFVKYVAIFRNKGKEIGVSLTHPHSQIYALPFVPPRIVAEIEALNEYRSRTGKCLLCDIVKHELSKKERVIYENAEFVVILPFYAMWPYELHVYPKRHIKSISHMDIEKLMNLADALRVVTALFTSLLRRDAPYIMAFHNPPLEAENKDLDFHFHVEFYQPYRDSEKLKYAAGIEWGYWVFTYDGSPEIKAKELRSICIDTVEKIGEILGKCNE
ncbi:MAG: galactose-1-phosphate uridylyltransferase [Desulfurococcaceae archaeon]